MKKEYEPLLYPMREIYKEIIERVVTTGEVEDSDILFIRLFKTEFEQNTDFKEN